LTSTITYLTGVHFYNGTADLDIAVVSHIAATEASDETNVLTIIQNMGGGTFTTGATINNVGEKIDHVFALGNLANTGQEDLAVMHNNQSFFSYIRGGTTSVSHPSTTRDPIEAVSGDVDGGAGLDIVTAESEKRAFGIFSGNGIGGFSRTQIGFTTKVTFPRLLNVDGGNGDDLVFLQPNSDRIGVLINLP